MKVSTPKLYLNKCLSKAGKILKSVLVCSVVSVTFAVGMSVAEQAPEFVWARSTGGQGRFTDARGVAGDKAGNVYVTGHFDSAVIAFGAAKLTNFNTSVLNQTSGHDFRPSDMFLAKYDGNGSLLWLEHGGGSGGDYGMGCVVDSFSNVYVTGICESTNARFVNRQFTNANGLGIFVAKYDPQGKLFWLRSTARSYSNSVGTSLAVDAKGNVCVSGFFASSNLSFGGQVLTNSQTGYRHDSFLVKYDADGKLLWTRQIKRTSHYRSGSVAFDASGNIYFGGAFHVSAGFEKGELRHKGLEDYDHAFFVKYDPNGNVMWAVEPELPADSGCTGIAVEKNGNVVISGMFMHNLAGSGPSKLGSSDGSENIFLQKYDPHGVLIWSAKAQEAEKHTCSDNLVIDDEGSCFISGLCNSTNISFGEGCKVHNQNLPYPFIVKYDVSGYAVWARTIEGLIINRVPLSLAGSNGLWLAGSYRDIGANFDGIILTNTPSDGVRDDVFVAKMKFQ